MLAAAVKNAQSNRTENQIEKACSDKKNCLTNSLTPSDSWVKVKQHLQIILSI